MPTSSFARFCIVGLVNTLVDVSIFILLRDAGLSVLLANICSTSVGLAVSLLLNYRFTFKSTHALTPTRIALYIVVTLTGLWGLQPIVITLVLNADWQLHIIALITDSYGHDTIINTTFAKLSSVVVTLLWNYAWYSRVIFRGAALPPK